jgi:hypothetical protein
MGVHGLAAFLKKTPSIGQTVLLPFVDTSDPARPPPTAAIVDFFAFAHEFRGGDSVRGGQYEEMRLKLRSVIECWRACNLAPEFVVDGERQLIRQQETRLAS